jgi:hypothetical protein
MPERMFYGETYNLYINSFLIPMTARALNAGERYIGPFILPPFQRDLVWAISQKEKLIKSIYTGKPIGAIVHNCTEKSSITDGWLLDGQQRTTAILDYVNGEFPVNGWLYTCLPEIEKAHFLRMSMSFIKTSINCPEKCREIYEDLIYGGTPHDPK